MIKQIFINIFEYLRKFSRGKTNNPSNNTQHINIVDENQIYDKKPYQTRKKLLTIPQDVVIVRDEKQ